MSVCLWLSLFLKIRNTLMPSSCAELLIWFLLQNLGVRQSCQERNGTTYVANGTARSRTPCPTNVTQCWESEHQQQCGIDASTDGRVKWRYQRGMLFSSWVPELKITIFQLSWGLTIYNRYFGLRILKKKKRSGFL